MTLSLKAVLKKAQTTDWFMIGDELFQQIEILKFKKKDPRMLNIKANIRQISKLTTDKNELLPLCLFNIRLCQIILDLLAKNRFRQSSQFKIVSSVAEFESAKALLLEFMHQPENGFSEVFKLSQSLISNLFQLISELSFQEPTSIPDSDFGLIFKLIQDCLIINRYFLASYLQIHNNLESQISSKNLGIQI